MKHFLLPFLLAIAFKTVSAQEQWKTINVSDISVAGSPVSFKGTVYFWESVTGSSRALKENIEILGHNNLAKTIIAFVMQINTFGFRGPQNAVTIVRDYFYRADDVAPNADFNPLPHPEMAQQEGKEDHFNPAVFVPKATVELKFVQFDDGSFWGDVGDPAKNTDLLTRRKEAGAFQQQLLDAYTQDGDAPFLALLSTTPAAKSAVQSVVLHLQDDVSDLGVSGAVEDLKKSIALGAARKLKFTQ